MLKQLRDEVYKRVQEDLAAGKNIDIAGIKIEVLDLGDEVHVTGFGRDMKPSKVYRGLINAVAAEVMAQIKSKYRDAGPGAALAAVREE